jgi:hypothetical protein
MSIAITDRGKHIPTHVYEQVTFVYAPTDSQLNFSVSLAQF